MKTLNFTKLLLPVIFLAIVCIAAYAQGQLPIQKLSELENVPGMKPEIQLPKPTLEPVELVYDSNQYLPDHKRNNKFELRLKETREDKSSSAVVKNLENELIIEEDIEIEEWMLHPFNESKVIEVETTEEEDDIQLEPWMTDLSYWNI